MSHKITISIDADELDTIVVKSLQEVYQDCIQTVANPDSYKWESVDDAVKRMHGASSLLGYYMIPSEYRHYMKQWEKHLKNMTGKTNEEDKDTGATD